MTKTTCLLSLIITISFAAEAAETNVLTSVTQEGREARKNASIRQFDLDRDGKLDGAERNLLKSDIKSKMDPVRKRVYVPKAEPRQPLTPIPASPSSPRPQR